MFNSTISLLVITIRPNVCSIYVLLHKYLHTIFHVLVEMLSLKYFMFLVLAKVQFCKNFINHNPLVLSNAHSNRPCETFKLKCILGNNGISITLYVRESSFSSPQVAKKLSRFFQKWGDYMLTLFSISEESCLSNMCRFISHTTSPMFICHICRLLNCIKLRWCH